jgi:hypothetical protein
MSNLVCQYKTGAQTEGQNNIVYDDTHRRKYLRHSEGV